MVMRRDSADVFIPLPLMLGPLSALPIESLDKGAICHLFSSHESRLIFLLKSTYDPSEERGGKN